MIAHINNALELIRVVDDYATNEEMTTPLVLVIHAGGTETHRFIFGKHGVVKQSCDARGEPL